MKIAQERQLTAFLYYFRLVLSQAVIETLEKCYVVTKEKLTGPKKPRFELIMVIKDELST